VAVITEGATERLEIANVVAFLSSDEARSVNGVSKQRQRQPRVQQAETLMLAARGLREVGQRLAVLAR
jgi:hypothetical protein